MKQMKKLMGLTYVEPDLENMAERALAKSANKGTSLKKKGTENLTIPYSILFLKVFCIKIKLYIIFTKGGTVCLLNTQESLD